MEFRNGSILTLLRFTVVLSLLCTSASATLTIRSSSRNNIALHRPYRLSPAPNYPLCTDAADSTQLTDGQISPNRIWTHSQTVGWQNVMAVLVVVDLGKVYPISGVSYHTAGG